MAAFPSSFLPGSHFISSFNTPPICKNIILTVPFNFFAILSMIQVLINEEVNRCLKRIFGYHCISQFYIQRTPLTPLSLSLGILNRFDNFRVNEDDSRLFNWSHHPAPSRTRRRSGNDSR